MPALEIENLRCDKMSSEIETSEDGNHSDAMPITETSSILRLVMVISYISGDY
jgi:hypothetical protein